MTFFKDVIAHLLKNAFEGHTKFSVADNTAVGDNPVRSISLDAVPANESTIISLSWDGGEKLFEKSLSEQEASHQFDLISTDLAEVAALTKQGQYDAAKDLMKKLGQKYAENTGDIVDTNLPKLHNTQASEDDHLLRTAKITMQNLWFSTTDELLEYQEKQKGAKSNQDHIPLWDAQKGKGPAKASDTLAPASLSYEDLENEKERDHEDMTKHIDEKIKTELESALQEKAASVFGPADIELVKSLRAPGIGRNWDEIKKIFIKDLNRDKDATTIFLDEQRSSLDPAGIEVEPVKEEEKPLTPPEDLVSPETHEKLLQDHEDKKKVDSPVTEEKELNFTPKDVMDIPEDEEIEQASSMSNEIARADNDEIHKVAIWQDRLQNVYDSLEDFKQWDSVYGLNQRLGFPSVEEAWNANPLIQGGTNPASFKTVSSLKTAGPSDLNPLQEPIEEQPTSSVPPQDVVPMGKNPADHNAPQHGDRVFVTTDLSNEKSGFEANFINSFKGNHGEDLALVETDQGDQLNIELNRVVKINEGSGAQDTEPVMEPEIATQKEQEIPVTPKMDDFHTSSQDELLSIKKEAEDLLKIVAELDIESTETFTSPIAVDDIYMAQLLGHEEISFMKPTNIQWQFDMDLRNWGVKSVNIYVPDQAITLDYEYFKQESAEGAADDGYEPESKKVQLTDVQVEGLDRTGFDSLAPQTLEYTREGKWVLDFGTSEHYSSKYPRLIRKADGSLPPEHICEQCKKPMGYQGFINPVCDKCVRKNHKKVTQGSDFEKGISQNKTSADPVDAPKTQFKDYKITPKYTPKEDAVPATPEMSDLLTKIDSLQTNLGTLAMARKQMEAKLKEELAKIDEQGGRAEMEAALQETIEQTGILFDALENKVVQWKDKLYTLQTEQIDLVPNLSPKEMLAKLYAKFDGAEKYVQDVLNGMLSQAKRIVEKTLIRWPNKKSSVNKEASILDELKHYNEELLAALKELSSPL